MIIINQDDVFLKHSLPEVLWRNVSIQSGPKEPTDYPNTLFIKHFAALCSEVKYQPLKFGLRTSTESTIRDLIFIFFPTVFVCFLAPFYAGIN